MLFGNFSPYIKKIQKSKFFEVIAAKLLAWMMSFSFRTTRWTELNSEIPEQYQKDGSPFIVCHWHDRLMVTPCVWRWEKPLHVLASNHSDGRLIAKIVENFSMPAVYGSTGKGLAALKELIKLVKSGEYIAIIPDGPRGPRHKLAPGAVAISRLTHTDILPFSFCVKRYFCFNSWDKFIFVWPFNRGIMAWGKPISSNLLKNMGDEESRVYVENAINETTQMCLEYLEKNKI